MNPILKPGTSVNDVGAKPPSSIKWALTGLSLSMLLSSLGTSIANVALPMLVAAFHASFQQVQWVVLAYLLAITTLIVGVGRIGDVIGRRRLMLTGIFIFTFASILCGIAASLWWLIAARAAQGLGAAIMMALTLALVSETAPKEKTGSAMGLLGTMSAIGTALGPTLGGLLIAGFGWRSIFFINLPLGVLTFIFAYLHLPADRKSTTSLRANFDIAGTLLLAVTLAAYALAMTVHGNSVFGLLNIVLLLIAVSGACVFVLIETKARTPLIQLSMFQNPRQSAGLAMSAIVTTVVMATLVVGPFYLSGALALDTASVGLVMSSGPFIAALTGVPAGRIVDRWGAQQVSITGLVAMLVGCFIFSIITIRFGIAAYIAPLVIITAGYALFQTANNTSVMSNISPDQRGVVSGMLNLSRNLGLITGASVMGAIFAFAANTGDVTAENPDAVARGMQMTFSVSLIFILLALAIAVLSGKLARKVLLPSV